MLLHEAGGLEVVTQAVQVASLAHACSWLQHDCVRQPSQVASLVVKPQPELLPLELLLAPAPLLDEVLVVVDGPHEDWQVPLQ